MHINALFKGDETKDFLKQKASSWFDPLLSNATGIIPMFHTP